MSTERRQIDKNVRALVWEKQFGNKLRAKCPCCEVREITFNSCHISHKVSLANGGSNNPRNLIPLCSQCNQSMGSMNYREYTSKILGKKPKKINQERELNSFIKSITAMQKISDKANKKYGSKK